MNCRGSRGIAILAQFGRTVISFCNFSVPFGAILVPLGSSWRPFGPLLGRFWCPVCPSTVQSAGGVRIELSGLPRHCYFSANWWPIAAILPLFGARRSYIGVFWSSFSVMFIASRSALGLSPRTSCSTWCQEGIRRLAYRDRVWFASWLEARLFLCCSLLPPTMSACSQAATKIYEHVHVHIYISTCVGSKGH